MATETNLNSIGWGIVMQACQQCAIGMRLGNKKVAIVDESDSVIIDNMFYVARLASSLSGSEGLQFIYYAIWKSFRANIDKIVYINNIMYILKGKVQKSVPTIRYQYNSSPTDPSKTSTI